jgi:hypothetical protein
MEVLVSRRQAVAGTWAVAVPGSRAGRPAESYSLIDANGAVTGAADAASSGASQ